MLSPEESCFGLPGKIIKNILYNFKWNLVLYFHIVNN